MLKHSIFFFIYLIEHSFDVNSLFEQEKKKVKG
jgi:hypothetical protein